VCLVRAVREVQTDDVGAGRDECVDDLTALQERGALGRNIEPKAELGRSVETEDERPRVQVADRADAERSLQTSSSKRPLRSTGSIRAARIFRRTSSTGARREVAQGEREQAALAVESALLARYERIRRGKTAFAVYPLHGDACGRCYTAVPTQRRALIQRGASIESCEACGVLLYSSA
jgi:predicted  nucleic acid-binding Zn-ribbon protein